MGHLLVVEDHPDIASALALLASLEGCESSVARNGEAAINLLRAPHVFDLVILDCHMPGLSGLDVLRDMKAHPPRLNVPPIVMYSADEKCRADSLAFGAVEYVSKGVHDVDRLLELIHEHCCDHDRAKP